MILMDTNEPEWIYSKLHEQGLKVIRKKLEIADYIVKVHEYVIPVERKTSNDYVASIMDGRLFKQLFELSTNYPFSYIVVVGIISEALMDRGFSRRAFISSLIGSSLKRSPYGCRGQVVTINLETDYDFILFLYFLHRKLMEGDVERLPRINVRKRDRKEALIMMYSCIPGVGVDRARKLVEVFDTPEKLIRASIYQIMRVEGIGEKLAYRIYRFLHGGVEDEIGGTTTR